MQNNRILAVVIALLLVAGAAAGWMLLGDDASGSPTTGERDRVEERVPPRDQRSRLPAERDAVAERSTSPSANQGDAAPVTPAESSEVATSEAPRLPVAEPDEGKAPETTKLEAEEVRANDFDAASTIPYGVTISGRVLDSDSMGVEGAVIRATLPTWMTTSDERLSGIRRRISAESVVLGGQPHDKYVASASGLAISGPGGGYSITVVGRVDPKLEVMAVQLSAKLDGYSSKPVNVNGLRAGEAKTGVTLDVWKVGGIEGRVVYTGSDEGVPSASVRANPFGNDEFGVGRPSATSGEDGKFKIEGLRPGSYVVSAQLSTGTQNTIGFMSFRMGGDREHSLKEGEVRVEVTGGKTTGPITISIPRNSELVFRTNPTGLGALRVSVEGAQPSGGGVFSLGSSGSEIEPDAEGVYRLSVKSSDRTLTVTKVGFVTARVSFLPENGMQVDLGTIELDRGLSINGIVVTADGRGVEGAKVTAGGTGGASVTGIRFGSLSQDSREQSTTTGPDGRFELSGLIPGSTPVTATAEGFSKAVQTVGLVAGVTPPPIRLVLSVGGVIHGTVTGPADSGDENEERVTVFAGESGNFVSTTGRSVAAIPAEEASRFSGNSLIYAARSASIGGRIENGKYRIENVPPGEYVLVAIWADLSASRAGVRVTDESVQIVDFDLTIKGEVQGTVTGADGNPLANQVIEVVASPWTQSPEGTARTNAAGKYRIDGISPGTWYVRLEGSTSNNHSESESRRFEINNTNRIATVDIDLTSKFPVLQGIVTLSGVARFAGVQAVLASSPGTPVGTGVVRPDGSYEVRELPNGEYFLHFYDGMRFRIGTLIGRVPVSVSGGPGQVIERNFDLRAGSLEGTVRVPEGVDARTLGVTLTPMEGSLVLPISGAIPGSVSLSVNQDGSFAAASMVEGKYMARVTGGGLAPTETELTVSGPTRVTLDAGASAGVLEITILSIDGTAPVTQGSPSGFVMRDRVIIRDSSGKEVDTENRGFMFGGISAGKVITIGELAAGSYTATVLASQTQPASVSFSVKSGETTRREISLTYGAGVEIRIENPEVRAFSVTLADDAGNPVMLNNGHGWSSPAGNLSRQLTGLIPGRYVATITSIGFEPQQVTVTVSLGPIQTVPVTLMPK